MIINTKLIASMLFAGLIMAGSAVRAETVIGAAGPLTGTNAAFGEQLKNGVQLAVDDLNAKGGILGQRLSVMFGDDQGDPKQGVSVANRFVGENVKFVIGHMFSGVSIAASNVYAENSMLMITPAASNPAVTDRGLWDVFRTCGRDDQQGSIAAQYLAQRFKDARIAIIHDKTTYGKGLADATKASLNKLGVHEILYEGVNAGEKDYSALVSKLKQDNVGVVYYGGLYTEAGLILRQMRDAGAQAKFMSGDGMMSTEFWSVSGGTAEGALMTFPGDPQNLPEAQSVVSESKAKHLDPEGYTLYAYAAVQVLAAAIEKANSFDTKTVAQVMHSGASFSTVIGPVSYEKNGDMNQPTYKLFVWQNGHATQQPN